MAFAQRNSAISGFVVDPTDAAIAGATLRIQQSDGSILRQTQSGPKGEFSFSGLPVGNYFLAIPAYSGFAPRTLPVHLQASLSNLKVTLVPSSVSQDVTVSNGDSTLATDSAANRDTVAVSGDRRIRASTS